MSLPCKACKASTNYRIIIGGTETVPCCGAFRCEVKLRDGVDLCPPKPVREWTVSELRAIFDDAADMCGAGDPDLIEDRIARVRQVQREVFRELRIK